MAGPQVDNVLWTFVSRLGDEHKVQEPHEQEDHDVNRALAPVEDNVGHFGKCEECVDEHDEGG